jgi:hypothetical protein
VSAPLRVFLGWDVAQMVAWNVAAFSLRCRASVGVDVQRLAIQTLRAQGLYTRPTTVQTIGYWDTISAAPMSTGHAIARFLVPHLCGYDGWALFADGDVLVRADVAALFALADPTKALQVVQHVHDPREAVKMTGHAQTTYARKNWSSVMLLNCAHPANRALTVALVNTVPGRDLHRFCWLTEDLIGPLPARWNVLIGEETDPDPAIAHFTRGVPDMPGYDQQPYADEWYATAKGVGYRLPRPPRPLEATA